MELINLKQMKQMQLGLPNLTKEDKKALWLMFKRERENNRRQIVEQITENEFIESEILENGALVCKGWGEPNEISCCVIANINDSEFCLYDDFTMRIGSHVVKIDFKGIKIFETDIESIHSFSIRWGC